MPGIRSFHFTGQNGCRPSGFNTSRIRCVITPTAIGGQMTASTAASQNVCVIVRCFSTDGLTGM